MYFQQKNFFPSLNQSNQDLKKMMDLSMDNEDQILENNLIKEPSKLYRIAKKNYNQSNIESPNYSLSKQPLVIDSENQDENYSQKQQNQKESSSCSANNQFSEYEEQIKELLPQIHSHLIEKYYTQYEHAHQQKLQKYKAEIGFSYKAKIERQIDEIKENISKNMNHQVQQSSILKEKIKCFKKQSTKDNLSKQTLTQEQQNQLVQKTVHEIFQSDRLLNEIKQKIKPKIQQRVRFILVRDLEKQLMKCQNQIQDKIAEEREGFKSKRKDHWEQQAHNELKNLAQQYEQLKRKKSTMDDIVRQKVVEKQNTLKKFKEATEKCKQLKQLQKQIKQMEQKTANETQDKRKSHKSKDSKIR